MRRTSTLVVLMAAAFLLFSLINPGSGETPAYAAGAAGIFGIYIGFAISNSRSRQSRVNQMLKAENASNLLVYRLSAVFGAKDHDKIRDLLDKYLIEQIDYRMEDFDRSGESFDQLYKHVINLDFDGEKQKMAHSEIMSTLNAASSNRIQIEAATSEKVSKFEWISIWSLAFVVIYNLYQMTHGNFFQSVVITIMAVALFLLVLVLRDLDNLKWQKAEWTWKPLHKLFQDMELIPYYPRIIVEIGEAKIPSGEKVRLADYPNPYPNMTDKVVKVEKYGEIV